MSGEVKITGVDKFEESPLLMCKCSTLGPGISRGQAID
jgi:hypothetical protein